MQLNKLLGSHKGVQAHDNRYLHNIIILQLVHLRPTLWRKYHTRPHVKTPEVGQYAGPQRRAYRLDRP